VPPNIERNRNQYMERDRVSNAPAFLAAREIVQYLPQMPLYLAE
jgi:hypothetical protein